MKSPRAKNKKIFILKSLIRINIIKKKFIKKNIGCVNIDKLIKIPEIKICFS